MAKIQPFNASFPQLENIPDVPDFFKNAKYLFPEYLNRAVYKKAKHPAFYIYEQENVLGSHVGLLALIHIEDYLKGKVVKHELTLSPKEEIMLGLLNERQAMIKPTVLTYPHVPEILDLLLKLKKELDPVFTTHFSKAMHRYWQINDERTVKKLTKLFRNHIPLTYIGDGHHRAATTAIRYHQLKAENPNHTGKEYYNYLLSTFFDASQLKVFEFNRVVTTLNSLEPAALKKQISKKFHLEDSFESVKPTKPYEIGMYLDNKWYKLTPKKKYIPRKGLLSEQLSVSIWNKEILKNILGIEDPRSDTRIQYVEGPKGLDSIMKRVGKNSFAVGFSFYPIALKDLMSIGRAGETMPPKSTWFVPRMFNGMIVHEFD